MEKREILIANSKTQRRYTIESTAETLGELKAQLTAQGIDFSGMTFTEGISHTSLVDDSSQLPTNVMYKGARTNNLVMLLTNPQKNVASGAGDRKAVYALIKKHSLQQAVKNYFGRNFTQVATGSLETFINNSISKSHESLEETRKELENLDTDDDKGYINTYSQTSTPSDVIEAPHAATVEWFYTGIRTLVKDNLLSYKDVMVLADLLTELGHRLKEDVPEITDADVDDMLRNLRR